MSAVSLRVQIECARARGLSQGQTARRLHCSRDLIADVWAGMDRAITETDTAYPDTRRKKAS